MNHRITKPARRFGAEHNLTLLLVSFAASVIITRLFLAYTGYPQIGGGTFHIAHVLWGGILLFAASLLPLLFANRWVYTSSAILAGAGSGLFIDELGKFVTATNDYFYPPAMPIIYALFVLLVVFAFRFRKNRHGDHRVELFRVLDALEEVIDHDLERHEYKELKSTLADIRKNADDEQFRELAAAILSFLRSKNLVIQPDSLGLLSALVLKAEAFEGRLITRSRFKVALIVVLVAGATFSLLDLGRASYAVFSSHYLERLTEDILIYGQNISINERIWYLVSLITQGVAGVLLVVSVYLFYRGYDRKAIDWATMSLIISLTMVNLLEFYFNQIGAVTGAFYDLFVFSALRRYRTLYLRKSPYIISN